MIIWNNAMKREAISFSKLSRWTLKVKAGNTCYWWPLYWSWEAILPDGKIYVVIGNKNPKLRKTWDTWTLSAGRKRILVRNVAASNVAKWINRSETRLVHFSIQIFQLVINDAIFFSRKPVTDVSQKTVDWLLIHQANTELNFQTEK